jgi:phytoene synthase
VLADPALARACSPIVANAWMHFVEADAIMSRARRSTVKAPRIMAEVYRSILEGLVERGWTAPRRRVRVRRAYLIWLILRYAIV